jgi:hypothetical protein
MTATQPVELLFDGRVVTRVGVDTRLGKREFKHLHLDATYLSDPQFRLYRSSAGEWWIEHQAGATNETIVDGAPLRTPRRVASGMIIAVGNSSKGIEKLPLSCKTNVAPEAPKSTASDFISSLLSRARDVATRISNTFSTVNWAGGGRRFAGGLATVLGFLGTIFGALFMGLLRGLGSSGGSSAKVRRGDSSFGDVLLNVDGKKIRSGDSSFGSVLMTIEGNQLREGDSMFGTVLATLDGNQVREGSSMFGDVIATIDGNKVREGTSMFGSVIATIDGGGRMSGAAAAVYLMRM